MHGPVQHADAEHFIVNVTYSGLGSFEGIIQTGSNVHFPFSDARIFRLKPGEQSTEEMKTGQIRFNHIYDVYTIECQAEILYDMHSGFFS